MAMDCAPFLSRGDVIAEVERRSDGIDRLGPLADAPHGDAAVVEDAAENALVDVDALDLVKAHFKRTSLDEAGLVDDAQVGDVGFGGPAVEPGFHGPVQCHDRHHGRGRQAYQHDSFGIGLARQQEQQDGHDPGRNRRHIKYPVRVGRIQHLLAGLQDIVDITPHTFSLNYRTTTQCPVTLGGLAGSRLLAPNRAAMYTRLLARALPVSVRVTLLNLSGNAPVVMGRLVMKFGGTSVASIDRIRNVARHVKREVDAGHDVAVVVSAMAGKTNELIEWCREASPMHDAREYDAVVASGEQVTSGLLAITLQGMGIQARSWQGWQIPIRTSDAHASARILEIDGCEIMSRFKERKEVAVIAGFQGINPETNRITTLGRGGSDTSAVAIAAAIKADRCDIYTDVDGVYTTDPRVVPRAKRMSKIAYEEMLELASLGAKVMQTRSVELAMRFRMPVQVLSTFENAVGSELPGTLVT